MTNKPKISFVIPCYNDGRFIRDAIESVEKCPYGLYELIIVDDGSTDEQTTATMQDLVERSYNVIRQDNKGLAAARNAGISASSGEYILPLDSDNKIRPEFVVEAVRILDQNHEISVVHGDFQYFGLIDDLCKIAPFDIRKMMYSNYIDACALYRKDVWAACHGYDEKMPVMGVEDWEFWLHAYTKGARFLHLEMVAFDYANRPDSMLQNTKLKENWQVSEEYIYRKYAALAKEYYQDYHDWNYHGRELRRRPVRTLFRLFTNALWPRLHDRIYKIPTTAERSRKL
ncbi:MAG: glycosyltransferase family 2 protein [Pyrinomonadaceae bacterium]